VSGGGWEDLARELTFGAHDENVRAIEDLNEQLAGFGVLIGQAEAVAGPLGPFVAALGGVVTQAGRWLHDSMDATVAGDVLAELKFTRLTAADDLMGALAKALDAAAQDDGSFGRRYVPVAGAGGVWCQRCGRILNPPAGAGPDRDGAYSTAEGWADPHGGLACSLAAAGGVAAQLPHEPALSLYRGRGTSYADLRRRLHAHCDLRGPELTEHLAAEHTIRFTPSGLAANPGQAVTAHRACHPDLPGQPHEL
jgi:hypothetical protein